MPKRKTHEEFVEELKIKNPNLVVLGRYKNSSTKLLCKCIIDNYEWYVVPNSLLCGSGCPKCSNRIPYTQKSIQEKINKLNGNIDIIGTFKNVNTSVKCKCKIDGYIWSVKPNDLLHGHGCPQCNNCARYSTDTFINALSKVDSSIEILGDYSNAFKKIKCRCKQCKNIWYARPNNLISGYGCPNCSKSKGEIRIKAFLDKHHCNYKDQFKFTDLKGIGNGKLSYDFYLPEYNLLIEYQGQFHDGTADIQTKENYKIQQEHDKRKREYAKTYNINLLEIWYWDFDNIEQILKEKLNNTNNKKSA